MLESELMEFVQLPPNTINEEESYRWTHTDTLIFLGLYECHRKSVGTLKMKNFKKMYEEISKEMKRKTGKNITPTNCANRWRVLERAYKKYVADSNKTGAARKQFEYSEIMNNILGKKKNVHPELLLSSTTIDPMPISSDIDEGETTPIASSEIKSKSQEVPKKSEKKYQNRTLKSNLLREIREDRRQYYKKRLEQEDQKLQQKVKENKILEEKNQILKEIGNKLGQTTAFDLL
ncbi:hypothetical protein ABEB36_004601 [Hypothenemus hampei]|uniref:Myb/SANT-like DNA-binding domain-containing protein n=1 Tax=Hypothenemus hampei TaxID=57062 RepID=A0ABD1F3V2_HYPHA